jgi:hypothetical protein
MAKTQQFERQMLAFEEQRTIETIVPQYFAKRKT